MKKTVIVLASAMLTGCGMLDVRLITEEDERWERLGCVAEYQQCMDRSNRLIQFRLKEPKK